MKLLVLMLCLAAVLAVGQAEIVIVTVTQSPLDKEAMQNSAFVNQYCSVGDSKMSGEGYRSQFAPDLDQCLNRCNRDPDCSSVDFSAEKICNQHNSEGAAESGSGWTHYHRRLKEQDCPSDTTQHVMVPSTYSKTFCLYADKKCPGHDLYRNAQNIAGTTECMEKCAKIKSCASADFKDGKCDPKNYACSPDELVDESGATFMQRLEAGVEECVCPSGYTRDAEGVCQEDAPSVVVDGTWGDWTAVTSCSVTCRPGTQLEERTCNEPQHGGNPCLDSDGKEASRETRSVTCDLGSCPVDGTWGDWTAVTSCSVTCRPGTQLEERTCNEPQHGGNPCLDSDGKEASRETRSVTCDLGSCPVDGTWGDWTVQNDCDATACGGEGEQDEQRTCYPPQHGGNPCIDSDGNQATTETRTVRCTADPCPTWCKYSKYRMRDGSLATVFTTTAGPSTSAECRSFCWDDAACKGIVWKNKNCNHFKGSSPVLDVVEPADLTATFAFNVYVKPSTLTLEADGSCPNAGHIRVDT